MNPLPRTLTRLMLTAALLGSLLACGGGGQDPILGLPSGTSDVTIETPLLSPPIFPEPSRIAGEVCTELGPVYAVKFNEPMQAATINPSTVLITERATGLAVAIDVSYDPVTFTAGLAPAGGGSFAANTLFDVLIVSGLAGVRGANGGVLDADVTASFSRCA